MDTLPNNEESIFTFKVSDVVLAKDKPKYLVKAEDTPKHLGNLGVKGKVEDCSYRQHTHLKTPFIAGALTGFMSAIHTAYQDHYPLKLSVSDFIILIGQGLGKHINNNAEELRYEFVNHEGKELIMINRDNFVMGQQNDWSTVFGEFAGEIKKRVKTDIYDVVIDDTSVATPTSRIVSEITLMNAMKSYFEFGVSTSCGIPQITLLGSKKDWEMLRDKVKKLVEMNKDDRLKLNWWLEHLVPVVDKICDAGINREVDQEFWSGIYKYTNPGSGTPYISGWIGTFFPYINDASSMRNRFSKSIVISTSDIPKQICEVPFIWKYYSDQIPMNFYGGFLGAQYDIASNTVSPVHFWSVNYSEEEKKEASKKTSSSSKNSNSQDSKKTSVLSSLSSKFGK